MGLFDRIRGNALSRRDLAPDPALTMLTQADADTLRRLVSEAFAARGLEVSMAPDHARDADGIEYGLWNLAAHCSSSGVPAQRWRQQVDGHVDRILTLMHGDKFDLSPAAIQDTIVVRLMDTGGLGPLPMDYAPEWMPGIRRCLFIDSLTATTGLGDADATALAPLGPWYDRGLANLAALLHRAEMNVDRLEHEGRWFHCAMSDSIYTSSAPLVLPQVVGRLVPDADLSLGVLFCVPFRHQFAFRVIDGPDSVLDALTLIPEFAALGYADGISPLSPHVYLWRDGIVTQQTTWSDDRPIVTPDEYLQGILGRG